MPDHLRTLTVVDHGNLLGLMGNYPAAYDALRSVNIDRDGILPIAKAIYYIDLSEVCHRLNEWAQADIWHEKMLQIYRDLPENKAKREIEVSVNASVVRWHYRRSEYEQALNVLNASQTKHLATAVELALLDAEVQLKLNRPDIARARLDYVLANGGRMYATVQAHQLLAQCLPAQAQANTK